MGAKLRTTLEAKWELWVRVFMYVPSFAPQKYPTSAGASFNRNKPRIINMLGLGLFGTPKSPRPGNGRLIA